jgi:hypothetical protein
MRAGVVSFGAQVELTRSTLECNRVQLDGESSGPHQHEFSDRGGNVCSCQGNTSRCTVLSSELAPPKPLPSL